MPMKKTDSLARFILCEFTENQVNIGMLNFIKKC
jgi:hypothetical protein